MPRQSTPVTFICEQCREPFEAKPSRARHDHVYCSRSCSAAARSGTPEMFWQRVDKTDSCWLWTGATNAYGYGNLRIYGHGYLAHRVAWELTNGPVPNGLLVCHNCPGGDNPLCVNPAHLWLGTHDDNSKDMVAKGRQAKGEAMSVLMKSRSVRGENHPGSKLTAAAVTKIRERYADTDVTQQALANEFGVSRGLISDITRRKRWRHLA